jgi:hypothetical protein
MASRVHPAPEEDTEVQEGIDDPSTPPAPKSAQAERTPVQNWTNRDVLLWLIKIDQKTFVPAFCRNNVTGPLLLRLDLTGTTESTTTKSSWRLTDLAGDASPEQLAGFEGHIVELLEPYKAQSESDDAHGHTYTRDINLACEQLGYAFEEARCRCILQYLKRRKEMIAILTLLISTVTTLVSIIGTTIAADGGGGGSSDGVDDGEASRRLSEDSQGNTFGLSFILNCATTGLAGMLTLLSGYSKIYDFDARVREMEEYISSIPDMWTDCVEQIMEPVASRDTYSTLKARLDDGKKSALDRPQISPSIWEASLHQLRVWSPETWRAEFAPFYDLSYPCSPIMAKSEWNKTSGLINVPFWARWLGSVEYKPVWNKQHVLIKALDNRFLGAIRRNWPEEFVDATETSEEAQLAKKK